MLRICNIKQMAQNIKNVDYVICFGAGKRLERLKQVFENTEIWQKIRCFIDNDEKKWNTKLSIEDREFEIISLKELKMRKYDNFLIIITCEKYVDIEKQLDEDKELRNIDYYCLTHIWMLEQEEKALQKYVPLNIKLCKEPVIPKVIHYFWFGGKPLPDRYKIWMESWHKFCPDYEIVEWNENNYDIKKNAYMYQAFQKRKWGFVPDFARLDIIYEYGGIYLDTDVELVGNIDDLLYQKGFVGFEDSGYVNLGSGFGAVKKLPIVKDMMDMYDELQFINPDGNLNLVPSPVWQTEILKKYGLQMNGEYQIVNNLTVYPAKVLNGKSVYTRRIILKPYTKMIHHFDGSWLEKEKKNRTIQIEKDMGKYSI